MGLESIIAEADFRLTLPRRGDDEPDVVLPFRRIPATGPEGFLMGSRGFRDEEEPRHRVVIARPFYFASVPVTQEMFACWTGTDAYRDWFAENEERIKETSILNQANLHANDFDGQPWNPAENVTWWEAAAFGEWLQGECAESLPSEAGILRLPTEAEWEYACRAGSGTEFYNGDGEVALGEVGWFGGNAGHSTREVGGLELNSWKLYDLHGNVWEWCLDAWDGKAYRKRAGGVVDPWASGPEKSPRVVRGGSWLDFARICHSAVRLWIGAGSRRRYIGFRVCLFPGPVVSPFSDAVWQHRGEPGRAELASEGGNGEKARRGKGRRN